MIMATFSGMPLRIIFRIPLLRRSWNSSPSYSFSLPQDWHFAPVTFWRHPLHKKTPTSAETHADHQASLKSLIRSPSSLLNALVSTQHYLLGASAILFSFVLPLLL